MTKLTSLASTASSWLVVARTLARCAEIISSRPVSCTGARPSFTARTVLSAMSTPMTSKPREAMPASMLAPNLPNPITESFSTIVLSSDCVLLALNNQFRLFGEQLCVALLPIPIPLLPRDPHERLAYQSRIPVCLRLKRGLIQDVPAGSTEDAGKASSIDLPIRVLQCHQDRLDEEAVAERFDTALVA